MRRALPIMVTAKTLEAGIAELAQTRVISRSQYFAKWAKDPAWIRALNDGREQVLGAKTARAQEMAVANVETLMATLITIGVGHRVVDGVEERMTAAPGQVEAIKEGLRIAGVGEAGRLDEAKLQDPWALLRAEIVAGERERRGAAEKDIEEGLEDHDNNSLPDDAAGTEDG